MIVPDHISDRDADVSEMGLNFLHEAIKIIIES